MRIKKKINQGIVSWSNTKFFKLKNENCIADSKKDYLWDLVSETILMYYVNLCKGEWRNRWVGVWEAYNIIAYREISNTSSAIGFGVDGLYRTFSILKATQYSIRQLRFVILLTYNQFVQKKQLKSCRTVITKVWKSYKINGSIFNSLWCQRMLLSSGYPLRLTE